MFKQSRKHVPGNAIRLIAAVASLTCLQSGLLAHEEAPAAYEMTVIRDEAYGHSIQAGRYQYAIEKIGAMRRRQDDDFFVQSNLCVAYTLSGESARAHAACDRAVALVAWDGTSLPPYREAIQKDYQSLALSNRGVLRATSGDVEGAREDFVNAIALKAGMSAPSVNLARLEVTGERAAMLQGSY